MTTPVKKKPPVPAKKPVSKSSAPKSAAGETKPEAPKIVGIGHNGGPVTINKARLKAVVDRIETIEEEIGGLKNDVKDVYAEAKANGMNPKRIREIIAIRRKDKDKLAEEKEERDLYLYALDPELADVLS